MSRLVFLAVGTFTLGLDNYVIAGLIPGISTSFATNASAAAQGVTAFTLCYALSAPVFSALLAHKPVRTMLAVSLAVFSVGNAATALAVGLPMFLAGRGVAGVGAGLFTPLAMASASAMASHGKRGRVLSMMLAANSAGAVVGVPLGLLLADRAGWRGTIVLITVLGMVTLAGVMVRAPTVDVPPPPSLMKRVRALAHRRVLAVFGVTLLTATGSLGLYTYVAPMTHAAGAANSVTASLWVWSIGGLFGSFSIGHLVDRTGRPAVLMTLLVATMMVAVLTLPAVWHLPVVGLLPFLLWGAAGWATPTPQQHVLISDQPGQAATVVALNNSALCLGSAIGSLSGGLLIVGGVGAVNLPYAAAGVLSLALLSQVVLVLTKRSVPAEAASPTG